MLQKLSPNSPILQATFGIERESLRINANHKVAQTPHPEKLGSRSLLLIPLRKRDDSLVRLQT